LNHSDVSLTIEDHSLLTILIDFDSSLSSIIIFVFLFQVNVFITAFYDSFLLYAQLLNETLVEGANYLDGRNITSRIWGRTFEGI